MNLQQDLLPDLPEEEQVSEAMTGVGVLTGVFNENKKTMMMNMQQELQDQDQDLSEEETQVTEAIPEQES